MAGSFIIAIYCLFRLQENFVVFNLSSGHFENVSSDAPIKMYARSILILNWFLPGHMTMEIHHT